MQLPMRCSIDVYQAITDSHSMSGSNTSRLQSTINKLTRNTTSILDGTFLETPGFLDISLVLARMSASRAQSLKFLIWLWFWLPTLLPFLLV